MKVRECLEMFYNRYELGYNGGVNDDWNTFKMGAISFSFPNLNKKGYLLHDVNHLLCGYGIDWFGEFETAAWELGSGGRKGFGLSWFYPIVGIIMGFLTIPRRTLKAYKEGTRRKNAHILSMDYSVLEMDFNELVQLSKSK